MGGGWTRITDKFLVAAGDTYSGTGGSASTSITLTTNNLPSHSHTFTGSEHSHSYTPAGSISVTTNPTFTGSAVTSGAGTAHSHTRGDMEITGKVNNVVGYSGYGASGAFSTSYIGSQRQSSGNDNKNYSLSFTASQSWTGSTSEESSHTHSVTASGSISGGAYKFTGTAATLKATQGGTIGNTGSGAAFSVPTIPPYQAVYIWERTS